MLGGQGFYRGSSVLVTGMAGTGKTSLAIHMAAAACQRGERCLFFAYEESADQIVRNMASIGFNLSPWVDQGLLRIHAMRPALYGAEMHLLYSQKLAEEVRPDLVVFDPINLLAQVTSSIEVKSLMLRMIDYFKSHGITALFTSLIHGGVSEDATDVGISSMMDNWIMLSGLESNGERNRGLRILKARGLAHSNQVREFRLTREGIELVDVYLGPQGVLTGSARLAQEAAEKAEARLRQQELARRKRDLERRRKVLEAQMAQLQADFEADADELERLADFEKQQEQRGAEERQEMARSRRSDTIPD
jgi:circadian clock protein KaiC